MTKAAIIKDLEDIKTKIDSIIETLEVMSDEELKKSIVKARNEAREGKLRDFDDLLDELGISV
ncbi:hypothetical protein [Archaeoglobus veneficus]|uniref:Uncharacterized protein n=1 Tax=Archaeoglobus veneficus (strain DSM 11195 / SNP6) TaxID=693661 RepID=F2KR75_ARCVS|nr:hypothetical protein [Archaeoglobus veneficus]AEA46712.1 hypothetical protein Arcve_0692 [Archaeoglobus veneficus SNP6]